MKLKSTGLKFKNLGNPPTTIQTPDNHISLPTQVLAVGSVGRGKTFWITNLLRQLKESKCMDRIFFISSTVSSNLKLLQDLDIKEHDIYDPEDPDCIAKVLKSVDEMRDELVQYREKLKLWEKFENDLRHADPRDLDYLTTEMMLFYDVNTHNFEPPKPPIQGNRNPVCSLVVDDGQSTSIMSLKAWKKLCLTYRHVGSYSDGSPPIGLSIFCCVQNYVASHGTEGICKATRSQLRGIAIFSAGNMAEKKFMFNELSAHFPIEQIEKNYNWVMAQNPKSKHDFLYIDLNSKPCHPSSFRYNYNDFILQDQK